MKDRGQSHIGSREQVVMVELTRRESFYLGLAVAMTATAFTGFWFTYFGPLFRGVYPEVSPLAHVHGWTFFGWYLLLPAQAGLIRMRRLATHRAIGLASIALGLVMIVVGLIVSAVRVEMARRPDGDFFWQLMGVPIFSIWILFTVFYAAAIWRRGHRTVHRQFIVLASAVALAAATFRILVRIVGFSPAIAVAGCLAPLAFILVATIHEYRKSHAVSPVYLAGSSAIIVLICSAFLLAVTPLGELVKQGIGAIGRTLEPLY